MRVAFAGTPEFSVPSLQVLIDSPICDLVGVFSQPDRPAGRGKMLSPSPVKTCGLDHHLPIFQPQSFKNQEAIQQLSELKLDLLVVTAYGLLLPQAVLDSPSLGCVNIHASLLPQWRGAAPIQRAIEMGDEKSGITLMQMALALDAGDILDTREVVLGKNETGGSLHDRLSILGASVLQDNLCALKEGRLMPIRQDESRVTYARKLSKSESRLDWAQPAKYLERKIRAFNPWPVASTLFGDNVLRVLSARCESAGKNSKTLGEVIKVDQNGIYVQTGEGVLILEIVQKPGGKPMAIRDLINGMTINSGMVFS